ncbi:MAG: TRAP transporter small permease [candidate division NC10 bacterium]|nr:TRAP transporter small permease [candidate division NC10 bacterium]
MRDLSDTRTSLVDGLLDRVIGPIVDWIVGGLVAALVFLVGSGVLSRYFFNYSLAWSDELAGLGFVWLTLLGSVAACRRRTHMAMGFFPKWFGPVGQRRVGLYVNAGILFFLGATVVEGAHLTAATFDDKSAVLRIPVGLSYLSLPTAGLLMAAYVGRQAWWLWQRAGGWTATAETEED